MKDKFRIANFRFPPNRTRQPVAVSLGPHLVGATCPKPDSEPNTAAAGVCHRFGRDTPKSSKTLIDQLGKFVANWLQENLTPLAPDTDVSFEHWIADTPYTQFRKEDLARSLVFDVFTDKRNLECKSFIKDECYPEFKHARGINSRSDAFKCAIGPWFKVIEKEVFKNSWFIKKIPVSERPAYIYERLYKEGASYLTSDYTSFEALFTKEIMQAVEMQLYKYMTQHIPSNSYFYRMLDEVLSSQNVCHYKFFDVFIEATRMSGEMCTSLGNGFSNLMFILFLCSLKGSNVTGVVEGDDGLFRIDGEAPTVEDFESLGLRVKLETHTDLSTASFCGLIFDIDDKINITCPLQELATFGLGTARYSGAKATKLKSLLKCKSLSLLYQYPGCPILQSLATYGLRNTAHIDHRTYMNSTHASLWEREQLLDADRALRRASLKVCDIPMRTRLLVEKMFGVTVIDQIRIEDYLDSKNDLGPIDCPFIDDYLPVSWKFYDQMYSDFLNRPAYCHDINVGDTSHVWKDLLKAASHPRL